MADLSDQEGEEERETHKTKRELSFLSRMARWTREDYNVYSSNNKISEKKTGKKKCRQTFKICKKSRSNKGLVFKVL